MIYVIVGAISAVVSSLLTFTVMVAVCEGHYRNQRPEDK